MQKYAKICKNMRIQTETIESLLNDSYRFLKFHMIGVSKKTCFFILCTALVITVIANYISLLNNFSFKSFRLFSL
jgi:hypothetical protein